MKTTPWGNILEQKSIADGILLIEAENSVCASITPNIFQTLPEQLQNLAKKEGSFYFFEKDGPLHYLNVELNSSIIPIKESLSFLLRKDPEFVFNKIKDNKNSDIAKEISLALIKEEQLSLERGRFDFIVSTIELNEGWKVTTLDNRELLFNQQPDKLFVNDCYGEIGDVSNFNNHQEKILITSEAPQRIQDKTNDSEVVVRRSLEKNSYILEVYSRSGEYLGEIDLFTSPSIISWWCND